MSLLVVNRAPAKHDKHTAGFKCKVNQFVKENGNCAAAKMFSVGDSSICEWKKEIKLQ